MPIYFGHIVPTLTRGKKPEVAPELVAKGIELLRAPPCDVSIVCMPIARTSFWALFQTYFSVILHSLATGRNTTLAPTDQEISEKHRNPFPLSLPPLCVSLTSMTSSSSEYLCSLGFEQTEIRGSTYFLNSNMNREVVRLLISPDCPAKLNEKCFAPYRFCNLSSLFSALDLITLFSYVSQAMGFSTSLNSDLSGTDFDIYGAEVEEGEVSDQMDTSLGVGGDKTAKESLKHPIASLFNKGTDLGSYLDIIPKGSVTVESLKNRVPYTSTDTVIVNSPGNVLRYVSELSMEDSRTVIDFIQRYLFLNLGSSELDCSIALAELKSSWGNLKQTDFGLELTHIVKCFEIGMNTQVSVMPIFDNGFYEACMLAGEGYSLVVNNNIIRPLKPKDLSSDIAALATHRNALRRIESVVHREIKVKLELDLIQNMKSLRETLSKLPLTETTQNEIVSVAHTLRFPTRPWNVNYSSVQQMLEIVRNLSSINDDTPIGPRSLFTSDPIFVGMSCFGEGTCPSFLHPNGTAINLAGNLPRPSGESGASMGRSKGKQSTSNAAWTLAVRRVRFDEAIGDLRKVLSENVARSVSTSVARGLGCVVFSGKQFANLFTKLGEVAAVLNGSSSLVRPRENADMEGRGDNDDKLRADVGKRAKKIKV